MENQEKKAMGGTGGIDEGYGHRRSGTGTGMGTGTTTGTDLHSSTHIGPRGLPPTTTTTTGTTQVYSALLSFIELVHLVACWFL